jgi:hypothetical protein
VQQYTYKLSSTALICISRDEVVHLSFKPNKVTSGAGLIPAKTKHPGIVQLSKPMFGKYISIKQSIDKWESVLPPEIKKNKFNIEHAPPQTPVKKQKILKEVPIVPKVT